MRLGCVGNHREPSSHRSRQLRGAENEYNCARRNEEFTISFDIIQVLVVKRLVERVEQINNKMTEQKSRESPYNALDGLESQPPSRGRGPDGGGEH
jgi:hypothetical protein